MGRGAKASIWPFSDAQNAAIDSQISAFEEQVRKLNPDWQAHKKDLTTAKKEIAGSLLDSDLFRPLWDRNHPDYLSEDDSDGEGDKEKKAIQRRKEGGRKGWLDAIMRRFTNHANNKMKPNDLKKSSLVKATSSSECHPTHSLFDFDISGKSLFILQNDDEITALYKKILEKDGIPAGGARNKAVKKLWAQADQELWEVKAKEVVSDVPKNQGEFPSAALFALRTLSESGRLGSTLLSISYAFRDEDDGITSGIIYTGYNTQSGTRIDGADVAPSNCEAVHEDWFHHADAILPRKPVQMQVEYTGAGMPICPDVDLMTGSPPTVVAMLKSYLTELWVFSWPFDSEMPSVPWADIFVSPNTYYDTQIFTLPCPLTSPELLTLPNLYVLTPFFIHSSASPNPFRFRSKSDMLDRLSNSEKQVNPQFESVAGEDKSSGGEVIEQDIPGDGVDDGIQAENADGVTTSTDFEIGSIVGSIPGGGGNGNGDVNHSINSIIDKDHTERPMMVLEPEGAIQRAPRGGRGRRGRGRGTRSSRKGHDDKNASQSTPSAISTAISSASSTVATTQSSLPFIVATAKSSEPSTVATSHTSTPSTIATPHSSVPSAVTTAKFTAPTTFASAGASAPVTATHSPSAHSSVGPTAPIIATPSSPPVIVNTGARTPPAITARPTRKRKLPTSLPTLVSAKVPAAIGSDGRPVKKKPGYDYFPVAE